MEVCRIPWVDSYRSKVIRPTAGMDTSAAVSLATRYRRVVELCSGCAQARSTTPAALHTSSIVSETVARLRAEVRHAGRSRLCIARVNLLPTSRPPNSTRCLLQRCRRRSAEPHRLRRRRGKSLAYRLSSYRQLIAGRALRVHHSMIPRLGYMRLAATDAASGADGSGSARGSSRALPTPTARPYRWPEATR